MEDTFQAAVERLSSSLRQAAPRGVRVEVEPATPSDLGWSTPADPRALLLTVWAPSGACRALGLLPRVGALSGREGAAGFLPGVVALGPDLIVVAAPVPDVAMTHEALERARLLLSRACAPIEAWAEGVEVDPPPIPGARRVVRAPHALWIELEPDAPELDLAPLWAQGIDAVVHQRGAVDGRPGVPHVVVQAPV